MKKLSVLAIILICSLSTTSVFASDRDCPDLNKLKTRAFKDNQILLKGDDGYWIELRNGSTLTADINEKSKVIYVVKRYEPQGGMAIVKTTVNKDGQRPKNIKLKRSKYSRVAKKNRPQYNNNSIAATNEIPEWNSQNFLFDTYQNYHRYAEDSPARTGDNELKRDFHVDYLYKKQGKLSRHTRKTRDDGAGDRRQLYLFDDDSNNPSDPAPRKRVSTSIEYYETDSGKNLQCVDFMVKRLLDDVDVTIEVIDLDAPQTGGGSRVRKQIRMLFGPAPGV